jgi:hypothetical protein
MTLLKISIAAALALSIPMATGLNTLTTVRSRTAASTTGIESGNDHPSCPLDFNPFDDAAPVKDAICADQSRKRRSTLNQHP